VNNSQESHTDPEANALAEEVSYPFTLSKLLLLIVLVGAVVALILVTILLLVG
jgi:hypothetical protein